MSELRIEVGPHDHAEGPADAPVTLVEYGDYECSYCGEAYPILKEVQRLMGDKLRFVFRNFPITESHPHAAHAAALSEAAAEIGKFWPMHDMLYENQRHLRDTDMLAYGTKIGLSEADVLDALNGKYAKRIERDFMGGVRSGVNGTPSLFINGERYDGSRDVESLLAALEVALHP